MRSLLLRFALAAALFVAVFALGTVIAQSGSSPALVFMAQDLGGIRIFDASTMQPIGVIRNPPGDVATDSDGNLYFADYNEASDFKIYSPPYTQAPAIIRFDAYLYGVGVDQRTGVFVVITVPNSPGGGSSKVFFFRHGELKPCAVVTAPQSMGNLYGHATFDRAGTVFFGNLTESGDEAVVSISGECEPGPIVRYAPTFYSLERLQFNDHNELVVQSGTPFVGGPIYTFAHPENGELGNPLRTTRLNNLDGKPVTMEALSSDGKYVWAAPLHTGFGLYKYPEGGAPIRIVGTGEIVATGETFPELSP
jgi:hypothetical protein